MNIIKHGPDTQLVRFVVGLKRRVVGLVTGQIALNRQQLLREHE